MCDDKCDLLNFCFPKDNFDKRMGNLQIRTRGEFSIGTIKYRLNYLF